MKPTPYSSSGTQPETVPHPGMSFRIFVVFVASLMAMNAVSIDSMLPALPDIGESFGIAGSNEVQWVLTAYLLGFGASQIVYGPLADRFGRKPVLLTGIAIYTAACIWAAISTSMEAMLAARVIQGIGAGATRVLAVAIVRDCYSGSTMARVMSLTFIVFLAAPIIAPSIGQVIILFVSWHWIFTFLALYGLATIIWGARSLPETLHPQDRIPLSFGAVARAFLLTLTTRISIGYALAVTLLMGGLFSFINSSQQIFDVTFGSAHLFTTVFAAIAAFMILSNLLNSRIVVQLGPRIVGHVALIGFTLFGLGHLLAAWSGYETLLVFSLLQGGLMFCFGLMVSNFNALAMQPMGHIAGTASSVQGFISTTGGALLGFYVGQHFDGTTMPLGMGYAAFGLLAIVCVLYAEKGRLFGRLTDSERED